MRWRRKHATFLDKHVMKGELTACATVKRFCSEVILRRSNPFFFPIIFQFICDIAMQCSLLTSLIILFYTEVLY